ncbi:MAG TPA: ABC transporter ATP-binding protein [Solirubrobacterales bacterium]|nr:ABC transporter ATP-binding protein [Solirubrobacterales bacterium]HNC93385.1 ABC transporter ATP-binding protein [Solirubrobacterales bacterium]
MAPGRRTAAFERKAPLLEAKEVQVTIGGEEILESASLDLRRGELLAIVGPNGAGKSTFARAFCGLRRPQGGEVRWMGVPLTELRGRKLAGVRAYVPQRAQVPTGVTVQAAVNIGRSTHLKPLQGLSGEDREAVRESIARARLEGLEDRDLSTLSGGEMQRVQIAVALAQGAPVLVADEPTAQLDLGATAAISKMLRELVSGGMGVVLIVHDLALAAAIADRVVVMSHGRTIATGTPEAVLTGQLISEVWGVQAELVHREGRSALHVEWLDQHQT